MKYAEYGLTQNETVIFLHGGGLAPWNYCDIAEQLQDRFHIIIPILDGHSGSDTDFTTIENNADENNIRIYSTDYFDMLSAYKKTLVCTIAVQNTAYQGKLI